MPLRILHVTPYSHGAWAYGGIPRVVSSLADGLARLGHDVTVATTDVSSATARLPSAAGRRLGAWPAHASAVGVTTRVFPNLSNRLAYHAQFYTPVGLNRFLAEHAADFDVAHLHACRNLPGVIAARHLDRAGVPYVLAPNGTAPLIERRLAAKRAFDALAGRRVLLGAARVLAVSEAEVTQLEDLGVSPDAIRLVPNPLDVTGAEATDARAFRERWGLGGHPVVMFLGKITPRKRVDVLVDAVARLARRDVRLVIAGNDMGAGAEVRASVDRCGLAPRTLFTGLLTGPDRLEALAAADVVVYPSEHEIFGLVPLEALVVGTPVVVSDDCGCGATVGNAGGGLQVSVGDREGLARAIDTVLGDRQAWRARALAAAGRVRNAFAPSRIAKALAAVYAELTIPAEARKAGVSFVVPVRNGAPWIRDVVASIQTQADGRAMEIIAVDDGSTDETMSILRELETRGVLTILEGPGRGAAAAINAGLRAARHPLVAQVDQDVVLRPGWLARLTAALADPSVAAAQGRYETPQQAGFFSRVMGLDLADRYAGITGRSTDHVCTGNTLYRASALRQVGGFDESLGYGADNDLSYRLHDAGYRLVICRAARSVHYWRDSLAGYCRQQYGFGYGRLDVIARHPSRVRGDRVSPAPMILHPALLGVALALLVTAAASAVTGASWRPPALWSGCLMAALAAERLVAGVRATYRFNDLIALGFPVAHLIRDAVWVCATVTWITRRLAGRQPRPSHSMRPRSQPAGATAGALAMASVTKDSRSA